jgi:hypothetical protein
MFTPAVESQYNMIMDDIHMQHRATREFIPPERKDEKYWFKRVRNNVSARKSRMKRKAMDKVIERKLPSLITFGDTIEAVRLSVGLCKYIIFNAANSLRS